MERDWRGDIVFSDTVALFRGHVGPNKPHSHWASQLTIALDGDVEFEAGGAERQRSKAVYLRSNVEHRLFSGLVCSIYFDPMVETRLVPLEESSEVGWAALSADQLPPELEALSESTDLRALLESAIMRRTAPRAASDARFRDIVGDIAASLRRGEDLDRHTLARRVGVSPSRFSHWFVEQSGIPLRSYKKWLKLRMAMDALLDGKGPTDAAMMAGFADLPHMSRAFGESFGLTYLDALHAWEHARGR